MASLFELQQALAETRQEEQEKLAALKGAKYSASKGSFLGWLLLFAGISLGIATGFGVPVVLVSLAITLLVVGIFERAGGFISYFFKEILPNFFHNRAIEKELDVIHSEILTLQAEITQTEMGLAQAQRNDHIKNAYALFWLKGREEDARAGKASALRDQAYDRVMKGSALDSANPLDTDFSFPKSALGPNPGLVGSFSSSAFPSTSSSSSSSSAPTSLFAPTRS